jgi:adenine phosphoribosyltransferase
MDLTQYIRNVPDFPKPGVQFKDISTLLLAPQAVQFIVDSWAQRYADQELDKIVGAESRGFIFGAPLAYAMGLPLVLARKSGKLPADVEREEYQLEYGTDTIEVHCDAIRSGDRLLLVDDLLATGGTMSAVARLVERMGGEVVELAFVIELSFLKGREKLEGQSVHALIDYSGE